MCLKKIDTYTGCPIMNYVGNSDVIIMWFDKIYPNPKAGTSWVIGCQNRNVNFNFFLNLYFFLSTYYKFLSSAVVHVVYFVTFIWRMVHSVTERNATNNFLNIQIKNISMSHPREKLFLI